MVLVVVMPFRDLGRGQRLGDVGRSRSRRVDLRQCRRPGRGRSRGRSRYIERRHDRARAEHGAGPGHGGDATDAPANLIALVGGDRPAHRIHVTTFVVVAEFLINRGCGVAVNL